MEREKESVIHLDTHIIVWLFAGLLDKFSSKTRKLLNSHDLYYSPIVKLELEYLYEIKKITYSAEEILEDLYKRINLQESKTSFSSVIDSSMLLKWTRDPFDRMIVATAITEDVILISADKKIQKHYDKTYI